MSVPLSARWANIGSWTINSPWLDCRNSASVKDVAWSYMGDFQPGAEQWEGVAGSCYRRAGTQLISLKRWWWWDWASRTSSTGCKWVLCKRHNMFLHPWEQALSLSVTHGLKKGYAVDRSVCSWTAREDTLEDTVLWSKFPSPLCSIGL